MAKTAEVFDHNSAITDEEIEVVRGLIDKPLQLGPHFNTEVTRDTARHFAMGYGDDNPLYTSEDYGKDTRYGGQIAPPTFLYSIFAAGIGPGFDGLQGFHAGSRWEFHRPLRMGEKILPTAKLTGMEDKEGRRSGRLLIQYGRAEYRTPSGELVGTNDSRLFRLPRPGSEGGYTVKSGPSADLTIAQLEEIEHQIVSYKRRGAEPRYWEGVKVGDVLEERVRGPLNINDIIMFTLCVGNIHGSELAVKHRHFALENPDKVMNTRPYGWLIERTHIAQGHLDSDIAKAVGMPAVYDNGWLRVCWMGQLVTDWMGDDAELRVLDVKVRLPNIVGDVLRLNGKIVRLFEEDGEKRAELEIVAKRHDGEISCDGSAIVALPSSGEGAA